MESGAACVGLPDLNSPGQPKHIVVMTDSPDTCSQNGDWWIQDEPCLGAGGDVDYASFLARVESTALEQRIPISIIQVQSRGYGSPDPAQMEIACLTGGTYQWINNMDFAQTDTKLNLALRNAYENVRDTIGGVWHLDAELPVLTEEGALAPGKVAALEGSVQLAGTNLLPKTASVTFVEAPFQATSRIPGFLFEPRVKLTQTAGWETAERVRPAASWRAQVA